MTAGTLERTTTTVADLPEKKAALAERPRVPLVFKLFGLTALLVAMVVALAVGVTIRRADTIAGATVNSSISGAARLFGEFERQRLGRLALTAELLGSDPSFAAYIEQSLAGVRQESPADPDSGAAAPPPAIDYVSILDQLAQRRESLGSDLLMLLDDQGRLVARTDRPALTSPGEDLYEASPMVKKLVDDASLESVSGVLPSDARLYHAAVAPIGVGPNRVRIGYLVNAYAIDDAFANRIAESTNAGVVFVPSTKVAKGATAGRSSNAPGFSMQQMQSVDAILASGKRVPPTTVKVEQSSFVMTGEPLTSGGEVAGAAIFLRSLDRELAPFRQIENALLAGGGGALVLAFVFSFLIARRMTRPIEELAGMAQKVTEGDYSVRPAIDRADEIGILGRSFAQMISALRDKAELEELYGQMAARAEEREREAPPRTGEPAKADEGTILVTDLRGIPPATGEEDARKVLRAVEHAMRVQEAEIARQDGTVREIAGHLLISIFRGHRGVLHAIRAARAINEELASQTNQPPLSVGAGIATGEFVTGSIDLTNESGLAILGNAPLLALLFAWHAPTGSAYVSQESAQTAGNDVLAGATRDEVRLKWLTDPLPVAAIPLASMSTGMLQAIGTGTAAMATVRLDGTAPASSPSGTPRELQPGQTFAGRYRIEQILGRGGMGVVYRATDTQLDETVAIKTLPGDVMQRSPEDLERFKREIRLARKITHRNVLRTYDYGEAEGVYFISMEFVRGYTLAELLEESQGRQMAPRLAMSVSRQVCRGLEVAHEQGIIHRDIKPQNVLIDHRGEVKLMDFGIARMAEAKDAMTQAGLIVGTPHYMSPEQVQGKALDPRSDVYSMGVMIYEMLAGARPFESSSLTGVLTAHIMERPKPLIDLRPDIGREINAIVLRCLEKDPKARYADAGELREALDRIQVAAAA